MTKYRDENEGRHYRGGFRESDWNSEPGYESTRGDFRQREPGYDSESNFARASGPLNDRDFGPDRARSSARGRFGERAEYDNDEPRYGVQSPRSEREGNGRSSYEGGRAYLRERFGTERIASRSRVRCRDIMTRDVTVATRDSSLEDVAKMMREEDAGVIPVVEDFNETSDATTAGDGKVRRGNARNLGNGKLVGLITDRDIVVRAVAAGKDCRTLRAEEIMTTDIHTAKPNDRVIDVIRKMGDKQVRRIPVVGENGNLRGIIAMADVALETEADRELAEALEEISSGASFWSRMFS
jgi:CBS domain-containing protein